MLSLLRDSIITSSLWQKFFKCMDIFQLAQMWLPDLYLWHSYEPGPGWIYFWLVSHWSLCMFPRLLFHIFLPNELRSTRTYFNDVICELEVDLEVQRVWKSIGPCVAVILSWRVLFLCSKLPRVKSSSKVVLILWQVVKDVHDQGETRDHLKIHNCLMTRATNNMDQDPWVKFTTVKL